MSEQKRISEWLTVAGKESPSEPTFPDNDKFQLGLKLILEELIEASVSGTAEQAKEFLANAQASINEANIVVDSFGNDEKSLTELRDACSDLRVVLGNLIHFAGLNQQYEQDFNDVMDSNFSKFCTTEKEANETVSAYLNGTHPNKKREIIECYQEKVDNYWIVKRKEDGKILKSIYFKDVNFD